MKVSRRCSSNRSTCNGHLQWPSVAHSEVWVMKPLSRQQKAQFSDIATKSPVAAFSQNLLNRKIEDCIKTAAQCRTIDRVNPHIPSTQPTHFISLISQPTHCISIISRLIARDLPRLISHSLYLLSPSTSVICTPPNPPSKPNPLIPTT